MLRRTRTVRPTPFIWGSSSGRGAAAGADHCHSSQLFPRQGGCKGETGEDSTEPERSGLWVLEAVCGRGHRERSHACVWTERGQPLSAHHAGTRHSSQSRAGQFQLGLWEAQRRNQAFLLPCVVGLRVCKLLALTAFLPDTWTGLGLQWGEAGTGWSPTQNLGEYQKNSAIEIIWCSIFKKIKIDAKIWWTKCNTWNKDRIHSCNLYNPIPLSSSIHFWALKSFIYKNV